MKLKPVHCLVAAVCGLLTAAAFPKFDLMFLAWISLIPLFFLLSGKTPGRAFLLGGTAGLFFYGLLLYWIPAVPAHYGGLSPLISFLVYLLLIVLLALAWGVFGLAFALIHRKRPMAAFLAVPFLWVGLEYILTHVLTGFPWGILGLSQAKNLLFIQMAGLTGIYGVSFALVFFQAMFVGSLRTNRRLPFAAGMIALVLIHFGGFLSLRNPAPAAESFPAAVIQGNVSSDLYWHEVSESRILEIFDEHLALTHQAAAGGARLIVWPEFTVPLCFSCKEGIYQISASRLKELTRETGATLLLGTNEVSGPWGDRKYYNSALCLSPDGTTSRYAKMHLVPFGEYTPYKKILGFVEKITHALGEVTPGSDAVLHDFAGRPFGSPICYEIIFPDLVRRFAKKGASFLVTITNDGWYGKSSAPYQHFAQAIFRAVENRRYVLRAATTGISGIIDPYGRVVKKTEIGVRTLESGTITPSRVLTFYARYGDVFSFFCLTISALFLILALFKRRP
ncbi:MAG: apolipoprotein N-acyltransferase [Candidatus Aminicenantes bacterium]|nr:apolipoprotein N-acyltransferase [Candidatus Aminicenantes bacterium]